MMFEVTSLNAEHKDIIHDIAYDFYGTRMATCSSDHTVKIWDHDQFGNWTVTGSWKAHNGSVWKVTWAHPEYGQVLATCSFDRTTSIWEEIYADDLLSDDGSSHRLWVRRANLVDARASVTDVKFAPKHLGLLLSSCSEDGFLRIYEAPDPLNLSMWTNHHEVTFNMSGSVISWSSSQNRMHLPLCALASDDKSVSSGPKIYLYEYHETVRRFLDADVVPINDAIHDMAFAPNVGRSYHMLAVASTDVRLVKIRQLTKQEHRRNGMETVNEEEPLTGTRGNYEISILATLSDHRSYVWRVSWNPLGTIVVSSGDDGCIRLFRAVARENAVSEWKCTTVLKGDSLIYENDFKPKAIVPPPGPEDAGFVQPRNASIYAKYQKLKQEASKSAASNKSTTR